MVLSPSFAAPNSGYEYSAPSPRQSAAVQSFEPTPSHQPAPIQNPHPHVPDPVYEAFVEAAALSEPWVASDMEARLFSQAAQQNSVENDWIERAWILREASAKTQTKEGAKEAIKMQNLHLAGRGQPVMQPAEEQAVLVRIEAMSKSKVRFLDSFISALSGDPLRAVA